MIKDFREFVSRGNVIDLAVAVAVGTAFTLIIDAVVNGLINPLVAAIFGQPGLTNVGNFTVNGADFSIGLILDALFSFFTVAIALYVMIVLPATQLRKRNETTTKKKALSEEVVLLREILNELRQRVDVPQR
jgi:large conductance mechanosensitive channel